MTDSGPRRSLIGLFARDEGDEAILKELADAIEAEAALRAAFVKARDAYVKAWAAFVKARDAYVKAWAAYQSAAPAEGLGVEHPDCGDRCACYVRGVDDEAEATRD